MGSAAEFVLPLARKTDQAVSPNGFAPLSLISRLSAFADTRARSLHRLYYCAFKSAVANLIFIIHLFKMTAWTGERNGSPLRGHHRRNDSFLIIDRHPVLTISRSEKSDKRVTGPRVS